VVRIKAYYEEVSYVFVQYQGYDQSTVACPSALDRQEHAQYSAEVLDIHIEN
jgi:hypothetical protein